MNRCFSMKNIVLGILAHVDSGKTTLSEAVLYKTGCLRKLGRVDHKDAFLDNHSIERDRGITIFSKQAVFEYGDTVFTLLDTPGHVDFSLEAERALQVLDYAVLVISGSDGVQSHTETIWNLLRKYKVPVFIFVNKMDLTGVDRESLMSELKQSLSENCVDFVQDSDSFFEAVAMCDESLLNKYIEAMSISDGDLREVISKRAVFPCFFGSALRLEGIDELLEALAKYTLMPHYSDEFGAKVYKIADDGQGSRLTQLKVTGGTLRVKDTISGTSKTREAWTEKVNQIRIYSGGKFKTVPEAAAGVVCAVTGLSNTYPGEGLGAEADSSKMNLNPLLSYTVRVLSRVDIHTVVQCLRELEEEEPQLNVVWNEQLQEIHVRLMGEIQLEVLKQIVLDRYDIDIEFVSSGVAYKETVKNTVEGVGHYEPLRHYAEVHLLIEPGKPGSGVQIFSRCSEDKLDKNWQRLIMTHLAEKQHLGVLTGSPVTDIKITLVSGRAHKKHTEGGDFRQATYRAVRQGLRMAESVLLEPWYDVKLKVPAECTGRAMTDLQNMNGEIDPPMPGPNFTILSGTVPVSQIIDYQSEVLAYTGGRGSLTCIPCGYKPCVNQAEVIEEIGYDCDADVENTADSVFCKHGAGFNVKWDEVYEYMHLESELKKNEDLAPVNPNAKRRTISAATDKELLEIFERTYGAVRREMHNPLKTAKTVSDSDKRYRPKKRKNNGEEFLLVDGYNIIFAWDELRDLAESNLEMARTALADVLCNYQGFKECEVILVFDAYKVKNNPGEVEQYRNIKIVYTKESETADTYIEKTAHKLSRDNYVRVATSDFATQMIILGDGSFRISARELKDEIKAAQDAIRSYIDNEKNRKFSTIESRVQLPEQDN